MAGRRLVRVMPWLVAVAASTLPGSAQEKAPVGTFADTAQVNLINVEVFVTDKAGKPVTGLRPEDFEVFEDGVRVALTNFYASPALPATAAAPAPAPPSPAPSPEALEPPPPPRSSGFRWCCSWTTPGSRRRSATSPGTISTRPPTTAWLTGAWRR